MTDIERVARIARISIDKSMESEIAEIIGMFEKLDRVAGYDISPSTGIAAEDIAETMEGRGRDCEERGPRTV